MRTVIDVEIWSDVVCPWCYIGKRRFERAVAAVADEIEVRAVYRPYQLDPTAAAGMTAPVFDTYAKKFGGPERAEQIIGHVTNVAAGDGLEFHMDRALRANTLLAHRLLWLTEPTGHQHAMKERLLQAYFHDGLDVGDPDVLADCAADVGLDREAVRAFLDSADGVAEVRSMIDAARDHEITAVPTFVFAGHHPCLALRCPGEHERRHRRARHGWCPAHRTPTSSSPCCGALRHAAPMADWRALAGPLAARVAGRGPRLVFVHGFTQTSTSWLAIADHFAQRGREVVIVDLPGHGGSSTVRADLRRTADLLAATAGSATYVGYSLGGRVCLHLALMYPHVVDHLAVLGATPGIVDDDERAARRTADEALAVRIAEIGVETFIEEWSAQPLFGGHVLSDDDRADRCRNTATGLASSLRLSGTGTQVPLWDRLKELNMPVLAMAGEQDVKFVAIAERVAASVPHGTFGAIHDAAHAAHLQQPMQVITRLERALHGPSRLPSI